MKTVKMTTVPRCEFCLNLGLSNAAEYDAKTAFGGWANMCQIHWEWIGIGLGTGLGQKIEKLEVSV